ncbi:MULTISPECIES: ubiquinol-cytochrome c reductase iron-sulfur subunit [unclassified Thioalkalivibrio]|uniref:ubiquinol-cytochrome c reductase iron-sulfur subunit n=1 Tax=unclassified Thioalkalivibrio TaxID=2621013 RepID=UPI0004782C93|nr:MULTISPECIES: ubiquinol-cytochrome c reductase iron-sulfur subunit [unclassified Thioalkalivibrio]
MQPAGDSLNRMRIRALLKLMVLGAVIVFAGVLGSYALSVLGGGESERRIVELDGIGPGELKRLDWEGRRILVLHRDSDLQQALGKDDELVDPRARRGQQPDGLELPLRSLRPQWLVVIGESTDLGCELDLVHPDEADGWSGGFVDRCRGGRYDAAGRVYDGQDARRNLSIPEYRFSGDDRLILGGS